jgi:hypothetical protein
MLAMVLELHQKPTDDLQLSARFYHRTPNVRLIILDEGCSFMSIMINWQLYNSVKLQKRKSL